MDSGGGYGIDQARAGYRIVGAYGRRIPNVAGDHGAGVGNNILEAGLYRTPVVSYDAAGISEMVINGQTGYCTPLLDLPAFSAAVETLVNDADLRRRYGDALNRHVTHLCSDEEIYRTTMAAYNM